MARITRTDIGNQIYHVINRANGRLPIFETDTDYRLFETVLEEGRERFDMRVLAYCLMPNHWHLILYPKQDGDLSRFMSWITNTHTRRWHTASDTIGEGHLYQGRYKSFLCQADTHFLTLVRYVELNAKKANLVKKAEEWRWGSAWRRGCGSPSQKQLLSSWPVSVPANYHAWLNTPQSALEEEAIERSETKNIPFGTDKWRDVIIRRYGLEQTLRTVGRPKNGG